VAGSRARWPSLPGGRADGRPPTQARGEAGPPPGHPLPLHSPVVGRYLVPARSAADGGGLHPEKRRAQLLVNFPGFCSGAPETSATEAARRGRGRPARPRRTSGLRGSSRPSQPSRRTRDRLDTRVRRRSPGAAVGACGRRRGQPGREAPPHDGSGGQALLPRAAVGIPHRRPNLGYLRTGEPMLERPTGGE
jgi:hypothetical protein